MSRYDRDDVFPCPHCGADVPDDADFCPACGASEESGWDTEDGWQEDGYEDEDDFDYDEYLRREFPDQVEPDRTPQPGRYLFIIIVLLLCLAFALMTVF